MRVKMTIQKIEEYQQSSQLLNNAIESSDEENISRFKVEVETTWNQLLMIEPKTKEKSFELIEFFLEQIQSHSSGGIFIDQCKWKILALARSLGSGAGDLGDLNRRRL